MEWHFKLLCFVALVFDYTAVFTSITVWQNLFWAYAFSIIVAFCFGVAVAKTEDFVILWFFSYVVASLMTVLVCVSPALYPKVVWLKVEIGILGVAGIVAYNSIIIIPLSLSAGFVGLYLAERYFRRSKVPFFVESETV